MLLFKFFSSHRLRNFFFRESKDTDKKFTENVRRVKLQNVTENDQPIVLKFSCLAMRQTTQYIADGLPNILLTSSPTQRLRPCIVNVKKNTGITPYSVRTWENTDQKKHRIWTLFTQ